MTRELLYVPGSIGPVFTHLRVAPLASGTALSALRSFDRCETLRPVRESGRVWEPCPCGQYVVVWADSE